MIVLDIEGKHKFKLVYYIHVVEIPTNMRVNSYKLNISKIVNTRKCNILPSLLCIFILRIDYSYNH